MPIYEHKCSDCEYIWEDLFSSWKDPVPETCPQCNKNNIERLISSCNFTVELTGYENSQKIKNDVRKIKADASKNEKTLANLVGEDKYHQNKLIENKLKK